MPKIAKQLTFKEIQAKIKAGENDFAIGYVKGLCVRKGSNNAPIYYLRWRVSEGEKKGNIRKMMYPSGTSLTEAHEKAYNDRRLIAAGYDPKEERKRVEAKQTEQESGKLITLTAVADAFHKYGRDNGIWRGRDNGQKEINRFESGILKHLGNRPIKAITPKELSDFFGRIWTETPSQARKLQQRLSQIYNWAIAVEEYGVQTNPADIRGPLGVLLKPLTKAQGNKKHLPAPTYQRIPELVAEIFQAYLNRHSASSLALVMEILTASRPEAIVHMRWQDIDLDKEVWTIPEEFDKGSKEFHDPNRPRDIFLSTQVVDMLGKIPRLCDWVFMNRQGYGKPVDTAALVQCLRGIHEQKKKLDGIGWVDEAYFKKNGEYRYIVPHATARSCFRTWAEETGQRDAAAELCLLHIKKDELRGAYRRGQFEEERRDIMQKWADFVLSGVSLSDLVR